MADIEVYRTIKKRKGVYSASDICLPPYSYDSISSTYYGRYRLNTSKIFTITETGAYKFGSYEVYIYVDGREVIQKDYHMYQNVTVQVVPNPTLSINSDLGVISEACSIKYNIYDNNPDIKFKITVKLNDVVISEKYNIVDSNYTIDLTDEYLSKLTLNSVNNVTVEIGTDDGGKILDKTVTFTKGNTKPKLNISSYNSTSATFTAIDTDNNLSKIEWYLDDVLKETITTDLTAEKTINYELTDNAIHALKIVATDAENATAEKVLSISKEIMPLQTDATLQDISTKLAEIGEGFKNGKTSIINTLALKNIDSSLNNTLVELSEKIKASFDSGDASLQDLTNKLTQANNTISQLNAQLVQRKRWATGTFDQSKITSRSTTIPMNLSFTPSIIFVSCGINFSFAYASARSCNLKFFTNLMKANPTTSTINDENFNGVVFATVEEINKSNFVLYLKGFSYNGSDAEVSPLAGTTFNWTAIE
ncbi:hypothetical protein [Clostridioides sp. ZZV15-6598]|uniref:hypothetical protein n=1 Tax=Clostridioides sp. ZZV15-6598 TaxID=2811501 RepID=UPI001D11B427